MHVGIHLGPVVAGVLGRRKYLFDVWGDTVNTAARLCTLAGPTSVYVSLQVWQAVQAQCQGQEFGLVQVKGKGAMEVFGVISAA